MQDMIILPSASTSAVSSDLLNSSVPCMSWSGNMATQGGFGDIMASTPVIFELNTPSGNSNADAAGRHMRNLQVSVASEQYRLHCIESKRC